MSLKKLTPNDFHPTYLNTPPLSPTSLANPSTFTTKSNYWKIDSKDNFSTVQFPTHTALSKESDTIAVGSTYASENLKIYQISSTSLVHLTSITLSDIQSLKFLKPTTSGPHDFKFLVTGHSNGIVHLTTIPITIDSPFPNAEIIKRFNHSKHIAKKAAGSILNNGKLSTSISSICLSPATWSSTPLNSLVSLYDNHVFLWDTTRSRIPKLALHTQGVSNISLNPYVDSLTAIVGNFGVSLLDLRAGGGKQINTSSLYVPTTHSKRRMNRRSKGCRAVEWCYSDPNYLATADAIDEVVNIWDIRKMEPLVELNGFNDHVTQMTWKKDILWTADKDGGVCRWDLKNIDNMVGKKCGLINRFECKDAWQDNGSIRNFSNKNENELKCGVSLNIADSNIVNLEECEDTDGVICLDESFLSMHNVNNNHSETEKKLEKNDNAKRSNSKNTLCDDGTNMSKENPLNLSFLDKESQNSRKTLNNPYSMKSTLVGDDSKSRLVSSCETLVESIESRGDFDISLQKQIDSMLNSLQKKVVNDTIFI